MNLGEYLHHFHITQSSFAEIVGASQGMVSHVITGRAKLTGEKYYVGVKQRDGW